MKEVEERIQSVADKKAKIRERYKGVDSSLLEVIPAIPQEDFYHSTSVKRVGVYARVSTDDPNQTSSYELQKNHYQDVVSRHENWLLVKIYADEGISGTSTNHRIAFMEMIEDCKAGKLDLIITKTVARFARNVLDCIGEARKLAALEPPVGIFFETENIYTLDRKSEMSLSFISTLAQEESHNKSEIMNASIEMRFRRGIFLTPQLLGYDLDENGNLVINDDEAKTVRLIYFMYLYGYSTQAIKNTLEKYGRLTKLGNKHWSVGSIIAILQNERYCGDVIARKTFTPNYLDHKSKKNKYQMNKYVQYDHHERIITREDFQAVQQLISNAKYGSRGILPQLHVIPSGALSGYVSIHPKWAGFHPTDYFTASDSVAANNVSSSMKITASCGDFDLRGYKIARCQFFSVADKNTATFTNHYIKFNKVSVQQLVPCTYVELYIHPYKNLLAVRPSKKEEKNSVQWSKLYEEAALPKPISGTAFLPTLFKLLHWNENYRYRVTGQLFRNDTESLLLFFLSEAEIFISPNTEESVSNEKSCLPQKQQNEKKIHAYPADWSDSFGNDYYAQSTASLNNIPPEAQWDSQIKGKVFKRDNEPAILSPDAIHKNIDAIITDIESEVRNE